LLIKSEEDQLDITRLFSTSRSNSSDIHIKGAFYIDLKAGERKEKKNKKD